MSLGILLFPSRKKERDAVTNALVRDFPDLLVQTATRANLTARLDSGNYHLVMCALHPAEGEAIKLLEEVKAHFRHCPVIWYAGSEEQEIDVPALAAAMRSGLDDYLGRLDQPLRPLEGAVRQALDRTATSRSVEMALHQS